MAIIKAIEKHIPVIQKIAHTTWPVTFKDILSKEQIKYMLNMMYSADSIKNQLENLEHNYLLFEDDFLGFIGFISYQVNKYPEVTKIHKIYVLPDIQGKGIGRKLINEVEYRAKLYRNTKLSLNVNRNNKAIQFYEHLGFHIESMENIDIGNGFFMEDYIMIKDIN